MTIHDAQQQLTAQLNAIYVSREAASISDLIMENITAQKKIDRIISKQSVLTAFQEKLLEKYTAELLTYKPVQYVLHEAWFFGMCFFVDENVLIPRPETEELVEWVVADVGSRLSDLRGRRTDNGSHTSVFRHSLALLDIGTGSGCIPIALKKKIPDVIVYSCDMSEGALQVAKKNAHDNGAEVHFLHLDFLDEAQQKTLPQFDIIISNPPYIPLTDINSMHPNVTAFEPHTALFVEDDDALIFYKAIAGFAKTHLNKNGQVFVEMHEQQAADVKKLFSFMGFDTVEIRKDMQQKDRMLKATMLL